MSAARPAETSQSSNNDPLGSPPAFHVHPAYVRRVGVGANTGRKVPKRSPPRPADGALKRWITGLLGSSSKDCFARLQPSSEGGTFSLFKTQESKAAIFTLVGVNTCKVLVSDGQFEAGTFVFTVVEKGGATTKESCVMSANTVEERERWLQAFADCGAKVLFPRRADLLQKAKGTSSPKQLGKWEENFMVLYQDRVQCYKKASDMFPASENPLPPRSRFELIDKDMCEKKLGLDFMFSASPGPPDDSNEVWFMAAPDEATRQLWMLELVNLNPPPANSAFAQCEMNKDRVLKAGRAERRAGKQWLPIQLVLTLSTLKIYEVDPVTGEQTVSAPIEIAITGATDAKTFFHFPTARALVQGSSYKLLWSISETGDENSDVYIISSQTTEWMELIESLVYPRYRAKQPGSLREGNLVQVEQFAPTLSTNAAPNLAPASSVPRPYVVLTRTALSVYRGRSEPKPQVRFPLGPTSGVTLAFNTEEQAAENTEDCALGVTGVPHPFTLTLRMPNPDAVAKPGKKKAAAGAAGNKDDITATFAFESKEQREPWLFYLREVAAGPDAVDAAIKKLQANAPNLDLFELILVHFYLLLEYRRWALAQPDTSFSLLLAHQAITAFKTATNDEEAHLLAIRAVMIYDAFLIPTSPHYLEFRSNGTVSEKFADRTPQELVGKQAMRGNEFDMFLREIQKAMSSTLSAFRQSEQFLNCAILHSIEEGEDGDDDAAQDIEGQSGPRPPARAPDAVMPKQPSAPQPKPAAASANASSAPSGAGAKLAAATAAGVPVKKPSVTPTSGANGAPAPKGGATSSNNNGSSPSNNNNSAATGNSNTAGAGKTGAPARTSKPAPAFNKALVAAKKSSAASSEDEDEEDEDSASEDDADADEGEDSDHVKPKPVFKPPARPSPANNSGVKKPAAAGGGASPLIPPPPRTKATTAAPTSGADTKGKTKPGASQKPPVVQQPPPPQAQGEDEADELEEEEEEEDADEEDENNVPAAPAPIVVVEANLCSSDDEYEGIAAPASVNRRNDGSDASTTRTPARLPSPSPSPAASPLAGAAAAKKLAATTVKKTVIVKKSPAPAPAPVPAPASAEEEDSPPVLTSKPSLLPPPKQTAEPAAATKKVVVKKAVASAVANALAKPAAAGAGAGVKKAPGASATTTVKKPIPKKVQPEPEPESDDEAPPDISDSD